MAGDVEVEIFGQSFRVATGDATPAYIERLAGYVDERMQAIAQAARTMPLTRVAVLAALNIADDLFKLRESCEQFSQMFDTKTEHLIALVQEQFPEP